MKRRGRAPLAGRSPEDRAADARLHAQYVALLLAGTPDQADALYWHLGGGVAGEAAWIAQQTQQTQQAGQGVPA